MKAVTTLSQEVAQELRVEILSGRYRSGDRVPSERELASRFGASRGAIREGLSQLEQQRLIDIQPGGARVRPLDQASLAVLKPLLELHEMPDPTLVDQFLEALGALACQTARAAIAKASEEQLNQLRAMLVEMAQRPTDFESQQPAWRGLLEYLSTVADNLVLRLIGNDLRAQFVEHMLAAGIRPQLSSQAIASSLRDLRKALDSRDGDLAAAALRQQFDALREGAAKAIQAKLGRVESELA